MKLEAEKKILAQDERPKSAKSSNSSRPEKTVTTSACPLRTAS